MVAIGATIGGGVFSLSGDLAASGAHTGAVLVGWLLCGIGMLGLMMCFFGLNDVKPELTGGIYSYAEAGWGDYVGYNSAYGYWVSALLANVSYATLLFAAIGQFFPVFGEGNNLVSIICASVFYWLLCVLVLQGVKSAASVNLVVTISKILPIVVFIVVVIFLRHFSLTIFLENFWGDGTTSFLNQVKATTGTTVWAFIGIEGAVAISDRAERSKDVGKATVTAFLSVLIIYLLVSTLSMGIMSKEELAALGNPPLAYIFKEVVGPWGATLINVGVIISLSGASLGYTIIAADVPTSAAKRGSFAKFFAKENKNGAPINSLILTTAIIQLFLIITYFNESTYQIFYIISASMIMPPYLLSALYYLKIARKKEGFTEYSPARLNKARFFAVLGSIYGAWLIYASGLLGLLITTLLYAPGTLIYVWGKKEKNEAIFTKKSDLAIMLVLVAGGIISLVLILTGKVNPFA